MKSASIALSVLTAITLFSLRALAQPEVPPPVEDELLDGLVGQWEGSGTLMEMTVTETSTFEWSLGHQFMRCNNTATFVLPDGSSFEIIGLSIIRPKGDRQYDGWTFDSLGTTNTFRGWWEEGDPGALVIEVITGEGLAVRTTDHLLPSGERLSTTFIRLDDGSYLEAGMETYRRVTTPQAP